MSIGNDGVFETKMPVLVGGHRHVTLSAPAGQRERISLYYGREARSFADDTGFDSIEFHPCDDKMRSPWPGGIRVRGTKPVRLVVAVAGEDDPHILRLGRPRTLASS